MKTGFKGLALRIKIFILGILATVGGLITQFSMCSRQAVVVTTQIVSNPANQLAATEFASFAANMMYEGTDDPFPTAGIGGELGKILRKFPKAFKNQIFGLLVKSSDENVGKNIVPNIKGTLNDAIENFDNLIKTIPKNHIKKQTKTITEDGIRQTIELTDKTNITLRSGKYAKNKIPTIEIGNDATKKLKKGQKLKIKFIND